MYDELVKSIHCCFGFDSMQTDCENCMMKDKREEHNYVGCCDALGLAAADAIEGLENKLNLWRQDKISRWIPVTERLPEHGKPVLLYFNRNNHNSMGVGDCYHDGDTLIWRGCGFIPTHWMPLPEPPKEE